MRNIAIGILMIILLSILLEPMRELVNLMREQIAVGTALSNAARIAKDGGLEYESQRKLDAKINEERFAKYFARAFSDAMDLTWTNKADNNPRYLKFKSNDGRYNDFTVELEFEEKTDYENYDSPHLVKTIVDMKAETEYKFKTKYLKLAEDAGEDVATKLTSERTLILTIKN
ncbi:hypothetical protein [Fontibacillus sp. BL9]|uniref:hypothetical protein n=1 Tax=Fontibacillus sp. BL9 TaxID=3389971 RepID=UPI00397E69B3